MATTEGLQTGTAGNDTLSGSAGNDTLVGLAGDDSLFGDAGYDSLDGGAGADTLEGGTGGDWLDGGAIADRVNVTDGNLISYERATAAVSVFLGQSYDSPAAYVGNETDQLRNINFVRGSAFSDRLYGSIDRVLGANQLVGIYEEFEGLAGNDTINGGSRWASDGSSSVEMLDPASPNGVSYRNSPGGVSVNLATGIATDGFPTFGRDTLQYISVVRGSNHDDTLTGSDTTVLPEVFDGGSGSDRIDGRAGLDMVRYRDATSAVNIDLKVATAADGQGGLDVLANLEGVEGSRFADFLSGGVAANDALEFFTGGAGDDTIDGSSGFDRADYTTSTSAVHVLLGTISGTAQDGLGGVDTLIGIEGVRGSAHADTLTGSAAHETFDGGGGNDTIDGQGGTDWVEYASAIAAVNVDLGAGTAGDGVSFGHRLLNIENVRGSRYDDALSGDSGNNRLEGMDGADLLQGGAGDDSLIGGAGQDTYHGGDGNDIVDFSDLPPPLGDQSRGITLELARGSFIPDAWQLKAETLVSIEGVIGTARRDELTGTDGSNTLVGGGGGDFLDGGGGDDYLQGDDGADTLVGRVGNDRLYGGEENDFLRGDAGDDLLSGDAGADSMTGMDGADLLYGGIGNDTMSGGVGVDVLVGGSGADVISGEEDNDYVYGGDGEDSATGGSGIDVLQGEDGNDSLFGDGDSDYLFGGGGDDSMQGGAGVDVFLGGSGADTMRGDDGIDYFYGEEGSNSAFGGADSDIFVGGTGSEYFDGGTENDYAYAGAGDDTLYGGAGVDVLLGEAGDDSIDGGAGVNYLYLGAGGNDTVGWSTGIHVVYDFQAGGTQDQVRMQGLGFFSFAQVQASMYDYVSYTIVSAQGGAAALWLIGVRPQDLTAADFSFS
ncbi:MAG TPA: hypothetical protein VHL79_08300 [Ramlibacter sp.]|jgi:Ca2+-binding RTX toxin-like protein|nr:hypothetical protein [Ramlibacter sp.]